MLRFLTGFSLLLSLGAVTAPSHAQLTDIIDTPGPENVGIQKSLSETIGTGQGDVMTPGSSAFLIARDPFRALARGRAVFERKFRLAHGWGPRIDDGVGDLGAVPEHGAGLSDSCAMCHGRPRGAPGSGNFVFTRPDHRVSPHLFGLGIQEMLADEITGTLRAIRDQAIQEAMVNGTIVNRLLRAKRIDYGRLRAFPDGSVDLARLEGVDDDLRVKPFFAHGSVFSMREFNAGAFQAEMGLQTWDPLLAEAAAGGRVVTPSGLVLDGSLDPIAAPPVASGGVDGDGDGVVAELHPVLQDFLEFFLLNSYRPGAREETAQTVRGRQLIRSHGCTRCHIPDLTIDDDRRVVDITVSFDSVRGSWNRLYATPQTRFTEVDDDSGFPTLKEAIGGAFAVRGIYTDFKRHDLGPGFWEEQFDGSIVQEFMTEPLWGVGTTEPYGHDGRSINLREVVLRHGGEAQVERDAFAAASDADQDALVAFLESLVLYSFDDTASDWDVGDPANPDYPQRAHGGIDLSVMFEDPSDLEIVNINDDPPPGLR